jgi:peptide/nickel transport system ATP-binding protein
MKDGVVVESASAAALFADPQHPYTQSLLNAVPHLGAGRIEVSDVEVSDVEPAPEPPAPEPALSFRNATIEFTSGPKTTFRAVDGVSLDVAPNEVVGLVGESGSGKSTLGKAAIGLVKLTSGSVFLAGTDITGLSQRGLREPRKKIGVVFQDPGSSLNPRWPIGQAIAEPLALHTSMPKEARQARVEELLDRVDLSRALRNRYPHQLSGGQRQRVGIARALALEPALVIADEPTSALDVSVQAKVLRLLRELQAEHGFACLFISHDLAVIEELSDRIAVMKSGRLVESGPAEAVLRHPAEAYTARLISAVPVPDPAEQARRRELRLAQA